jgi:peptidoglycan/LPS O-acetylase OafA/YrhL
MAINAHGKPLLPALTGLRFFAALAIFNVHFLPDLPAANGLIKYFFQALKLAGVSGVCMFFALSGFILAYSYENIAPNRESSVKFWASRFSRIYPVYLLGMLWFAPFILAHRYGVEHFAEATIKAFASFTSTALLVQAWFHPRFAISWNGPGWSLSVEAVFYLAFPFLAPRLRSLSPHGLLVAAAAALVVSAALSGIVPLLLPTWRYTDEFVLFNPLFHVPTFIFGASLGYYFPCSDKRMGTILSLPAFAAILVTALLSPFLPILMVHNSLFLPLFGVLFLGLARGGFGSRFLSLPVMVLLGESSYALYILQFSIGLTFLFFINGMAARDYFAGAGTIRTDSFAVYGALLIIANSISIFVFKRFESPLRVKLKTQFIRMFLNNPR